MSFLGDHNTVLGRRRPVFILFLLSLVLDVEAIVSLLPNQHVITPAGESGRVVYVAAVIAQIAILVAATVFWLLMFYASMCSTRGFWGRSLWSLAFVFGIWFTAQLHYLFVYRRFAIQST
jgi:hypothetical protein